MEWLRSPSPGRDRTPPITSVRSAAEPTRRGRDLADPRPGVRQPRIAPQHTQRLLGWVTFRRRFGTGSLKPRAERYERPCDARARTRAGPFHPSICSLDRCRDHGPSLRRWGILAVWGRFGCQASIASRHDEVVLIDRPTDNVPTEDPVAPRARPKGVSTRRWAPWPFGSRGSTWRRHRSPAIFSRL